MFGSCKTDPGVLSGIALEDAVSKMFCQSTNIPYLGNKMKYKKKKKKGTNILAFSQTGTIKKHPKLALPFNVQMDLQTTITGYMYVFLQLEVSESHTE